MTKFTDKLQILQNPKLKIQHDIVAKSVFLGGLPYLKCNFESFLEENSIDIDENNYKLIS